MPNGSLQAFQVGTVISRAFSVCKRNFGPFIALGLMLTAPGFVLQVLQANASADVAAAGAETLGAGSIWLDPFVQAGIALVQGILGLLISAALVFGTIRDMRSARAGFGECLSYGLTAVLPVLVVSLLLGVLLGAIIGVGAVLAQLTPGIVAGLILFAAIIIAVIVFVRLFVVIPVTVIERPGVIASFRRSSRLTSGHRWRVFALILVLMLIYSLVAIGFVFIVGGALAAAASEPSEVTFGSLLVPVIAGYAMHTLMSVFWAVVTAVTYHDLRVLSEGADIEEMAAAFE